MKKIGREKEKNSGKNNNPQHISGHNRKTTANNASASNKQQGQNRGNFNRNNNRTLVDTEGKNYKGDTRSEEYLLTAQKISLRN